MAGLLTGSSLNHAAYLHYPPIVSVRIIIILWTSQVSLIAATQSSWRLTHSFKSSRVVYTATLPLQLTRLSQTGFELHRHKHACDSLRKNYASSSSLHLRPVLRSYWHLHCPSLRLDSKMHSQPKNIKKFRNKTQTLYKCWVIYI